MNGSDGGGFPAWAVEPVRLREHDPAWQRRAQDFAGEVRALFGQHLSSDVVHVGSTAIPGLLAKPIIDLQAVSAEPAQAVAAAGAKAQAAKWMLVPRELDQRPWRWLFVRVDLGGLSRLAHLHLMRPEENRWREQVLFRDRLRSSPALRAEYAVVKDRAAAQSPDREAYGEAKRDFIERVVAAG